MYPVARPAHPPPARTPSSPHPATGGTALAWVALLVALVALNGSLYLSLGMGQRACTLCLYQRCLILAVVAVLAVGLVSGVFRPGSLSLLATPLALAGTLIAGLNVFLEKNGMMECPDGILEVGTGPDQSLAVHSLLLAILFADFLRQRTPVFATVGGLFLGAGLAFVLVKSGPPAPTVPPEGWSVPVNEDGCRPVAKTAVRT